MKAKDNKWNRNLMKMTMIKTKTIASLMLSTKNFKTHILIQMKMCHIIVYSKPLRKSTITFNQQTFNQVSNNSIAIIDLKMFLL